jgi:hypothetical protein
LILVPQLRMSDATHGAECVGAVDGRPPEGGELIPVDLDGSLIWRAAVSHARPLGHEGTRDDQMADIPASSGNIVRIGYASVSARAQDRQAQLDAPAAAYSREVVVETASTGDGRPKLRSTLAALQAGDTLVICKPDRAARSMRELLVLLEDQLHARGINLHILTGICAGL